MRWSRGIIKCCNLIMAAEDTSFYDRESVSYSEKRYLRRPKVYVEFFFQKRLRVVLRELCRIFGDKKALKLLDVGCADGIITRTIAQKMSSNFEELIGIDISPKMIDAARTFVCKPNTSFFLRDGQLFQNKVTEHYFDVVLGLGYVTATILEEEITFAKKYLKTGGFYIVTLAARDSIHARLKIPHAPYRADYVSYPEYRRLLAKHFKIVRAIPNGLFVPKLWVFPFLARFLQPLFEKIFRFCPSLYHEVIYVLINK